MKAATHMSMPVFGQIKFQSTPPVKAATRVDDDGLPMAAISIHAAREGGDALFAPRLSNATISIHAAREGGDFRVLSKKRLT